MKKYFILSFLSLFIFPLWTVEDVIILGGGPAGLTAAIYTARAGLSTLVIEGEEPYGQIATTNQVDNFPGFHEGINGYDLGHNMRQQALRFEAHILSRQVVATDLSQRPFQVELHDGTKLYSKALIIATGASPKWLGLPSENELKGSGVSSCAICDGFFFRDQEVVVVGGGDTAFEDALFLANFTSKVTIIHRSKKLKASKYLQNKVQAHPHIHLLLDTVVTEIQNPLTQIKIENTLTKEECLIPCSGVFVAIGHTPNTSLFEGVVHLDKDHHIKTQSGSTKTNIEGVFAAGDVADSSYRQAITAAGTGCMAGMDAYHYLQQQDSQKEIK